MWKVNKDTGEHELLFSAQRRTLPSSGGRCFIAGVSGVLCKTVYRCRNISPAQKKKLREKRKKVPK